MDIVKEHLWVTGGSGSGKSAMILAPLVFQLIAKKRCSILFLDFKDDAPSFWNVFDCAHRAGLPFKYFSPVPDDESFLYNHFRQRVHKRFTAMQQAELLTQTAGTDYGEVYGAAFFQSMGELVICNYLSNYTDPPIEDCVQMFNLLNDKHAYTNIGHLEEFANATHFRALFARMASISSFNGTPRDLKKPSALAHAMDMSELLQRPTVYYFKLPASVGRNANRFLGRSALQNLFAAAGMRLPGENTDVAVFIDEFQELIGPSMDVFLEQCRSRGIMCILSHQTIHQLERNGVKLLPIVQACTSGHVVVEASDPDSVEYVQKRSGKAYFGLASWSQEAPICETDAFYANDYFRPWKAVAGDGQGVPLVNVREELGPRLDDNTIHKLSADGMSAFVVLKKNRGFSNFDGLMVPVRVFYHIEKELFDRRKKEPWPTWDRPETVIVKATSPLAKAGHGKLAGPVEPIQIVPPPPESGAALLARLKKHGKDQK